MVNGSKASDRVVDLLRYKAERAQRRLQFDDGPRPAPALAPVATFRPLTAEDVAHRQAMLTHLAKR